MSVNYKLDVYSDGNVVLATNIGGLAPDNTTDAENIDLSIYLYDVGIPEPKFYTTLSFIQIMNLYNQLNSISIIREQGKTYTGNFVELTSDLSELILYLNESDIPAIKTILLRIADETKRKLVLEALSNDELVTLEASISQINHQKALDYLNDFIEYDLLGELVVKVNEEEEYSEYQAKQPEQVFRNWIRNNIWSLGTEYTRNYDFTRIDLFADADIIMEAADGYTDIIELKRPIAELFKMDDSHTCVYPSNELSKVIGQCIKYLIALEKNKSLIESTYKVKVVRPRIKIIIGLSRNFNEMQIEALRMLNSNLNHISIITYDSLILTSKQIIEFNTMSKKFVTPEYLENLEEI